MQPAASLHARAARVARLVSVAVCVGMGLALVIANLPSWELEDLDAYWNAALRLRAGEPLYIPALEAADAYRYAPWFAWAWIPLTMLPKALVQLAWSAVLVAAVGVALWPLARRPGWAAVALLFLMGGLLVRTASTGNVHALLVAWLVWGVERRSGPAWIALAASLKAAPIALVAVYLGRRQWARAAVCAALTAALIVPMLGYDLSGYPAQPGESFSLLSLAGPAWWGVVAAATLAATIARPTWLVGTVAVLAALPRLLLYDLTFLLVGTQAQPERSSSRQ